MVSAQPGITIIVDGTELVIISAAILIIIGLAAFGLYRIAMRRKPFIEQAFLIYMDGALVAHATGEAVGDLDTEIFSGMLTAIQGFIEESFKDGKRWDLRKLEFSGHKIIIERSKSENLRIALVYRGKGDDERLLATAQTILAKVEQAFGDVLEDWDGNLSNLNGTRDIMMEELGKA